MLSLFWFSAQNQTQQHKHNVQQYQQNQVIPGQVPQYGANPQAAIIQQAIVQQSINSAPWQQAQQQAQQQVWDRLISFLKI